MLFPIHFTLFSLLGGQTLKTVTFKIKCIKGGNPKVNTYAQEMAQKRPDKILSLQVILNFDKETTSNNQNK